MFTFSCKKVVNIACIKFYTLKQRLPFSQMNKRQSYLKPIFSFDNSRKMSVLAFGSGSGTNIEALLRAEESSDCPFTISAIITDRTCRCIDIAQEAKIPYLHHNFKDFFRSHQSTDTRNPRLRKMFDQELVRKLQNLSHEHHFSIDLLFLAGYMRIVHSPLLEAFPSKVVNIHPADLTKLNSEGKRKYIGAHAIQDAIESGESHTRSTMILVNQSVDGGPILASGPWVKVENEGVSLHQEKQKHLSDWPLAVHTL